jgi:hypothetical protein
MLGIEIAKQKKKKKKMGKGSSAREWVGESTLETFGDGTTPNRIAQGDGIGG